MKNSIIKRIPIFSFCFLTMLFTSCGQHQKPDTLVQKSEESNISEKKDSANDTIYKHKHGSNSHAHKSEQGDCHSYYNIDTKDPPFSYLSMNGEFHLNPEDSMSQNDPRNPSRLKLTTSDNAGSITRIVFYDHDDIEKKLADCGYVFIGSKPDPHYYPKISKTSIWDVFKKVKDFSGDCINYNYVISRSPHGDTTHMHLRYGENVEALIAMSKDEKDSKFNPWWGTYCDIERTTSCD